MNPITPEQLRAAIESADADADADAEARAEATRTRAVRRTLRLLFALLFLVIGTWSLWGAPVACLCVFVYLRFHEFVVKRVP